MVHVEEVDDNMIANNLEPLGLMPLRCFSCR